VAAQTARSEANVARTVASAQQAERVLLEREAELAELGDLVTAAAQGRGAAAVVLGTAGIGKTSLLDAARRLARERGLTSLAARGGSWSATSRSGWPASCSSVRCTSSRRVTATRC
jgi:ABC-type transport system involved in cytochrome bd biosynthesis fused ATPase/permease subunit